MKKNESVKDKNRKNEGIRNTVSDKNIPSEKTKSKGKEEQELQFKKVLYGFDPDEVIAYIGELNAAHESAAKIHESKLSTLKDELVLSNRERNSCIEKLKEIQAKIHPENPEEKEETENRIAEYEAAVSQLQVTVEILKKENEQLRSAPAPTPASPPSPETPDRSAEYEQRIRQLEETIGRMQSENSGLSSKAERYLALEESYNSVFVQLEQTKAKLEAKEKALKAKEEELAENAGMIAELSAENREIKARAAELEIKNSVLTQADSEREAEIEALREANKAFAIENTEKLSALESEHAKSRLAVQKDLKLYGYYVDRAQLTLTELTKQMEELKNSLSDIQP